MAGLDGDKQMPEPLSRLRREDKQIRVDKSERRFVSNCAVFMSKEISEINNDDMRCEPRI